METATPQTEYQYDPEFLDFAEKFTQTYKTLQSGEYESKTGKFKIQYMEILSDGIGRITYVPMRVIPRTGVIEASKQILSTDEYSQDYVYFMLLQMLSMNYVAQGSVRGSSEHYIKADKIALIQYLKSGRPKGEILKGMAAIAASTASELNKQRYSRIHQEHGSDD